MKREPSAAVRMAASGVREVFVSLVDEGFTEQQALDILSRLLAAQQGGAS